VTCEYVTALACPPFWWM